MIENQTAKPGFAWVLPLLGIIIISSLVIIASCVPKRHSDKTKKPNFILILTDDQGYGDLGCYDNPTLKTPNLDQMSADGIRLTDFYMAAACCTPSRAALLTGSYPQRVGLPSVLFPHSHPRGQKDGMALGLNPDEITLAELLKTENYTTAFVGKWHLGDIPEFMPLNQGFDEYFGLPYSNDMNSECYDVFDSIPLYEGGDVVEKNPDQDYLVKRYTQRAIDFIKRNKDQPFFLYLSHSMPHRPCHVSPEYAESWFSKKQLSSIQGEDKNMRDFLYPAVIEEIDWSVGELLRTLTELNLNSNTLVIFTSDNGPKVGSAGLLRGLKGSMYEGGLRVPCIMKWKGTIPEGKVCDKIATGMDIYPTLANLAQASLPEDRIIDGVDLTDLLLGRNDIPPRKQMFYIDQGRGVKAIRYENWKLFIEDEPQLYNLKEDIGETINVAKDHPDMVTTLKDICLEFSNNLENNKRSPGLIAFE